MDSLSYPQARVNFQSYPCFGYTQEARVHTAFKGIQVLDKKGENAAIHRQADPLSTTTNLN
jgi:hypothetical protein